MENAHAIDLGLQQLERDDWLVKGILEGEEESLGENGDEIVYMSCTKTKMEGSKCRDDGNVRFGDESRGTLVVTSKRVAWISSNDFPGIFVEYPSLNMHAVCRDEQLSNFPFVYCQVTVEAGSDGEDDYVEVRFIPSDSESVSDVFKAISKGASLFPSVDEDDEGIGSVGMTQFGFQQNDEGKENTGNQNAPHLSEEEKQALMLHWDSLLITSDSSEGTGEFDNAETEPPTMRFADNERMDTPHPHLEKQ